MGYRRDLWEVAADHHGVVTVATAEDAGVPAVELRKLASRGALNAFGQGVYTHREVPATPFTQPAVAVALAGRGAFLERESVLHLLDLGHFNPRKIRVGTRRRVRRALPEWMDLEHRSDIDDSDLSEYEGILATTVERALIDMKQRLPPDRWSKILDAARLKGLLQSVGDPLWEKESASKWNSATHESRSPSKSV